MDKLIQELLKLLGEMLAGQQRLLTVALARREAMRSFDIDRLESINEQERIEMQNLANLERTRMGVVAGFKKLRGPGFQANVSEISKLVGEPQRSQLLGLAAQIKTVVEQVDRNTRINATVSETVIKGLAKVLKVVTGLAQHAGLYMRNGRKAALHGIHLLEVTA